ANDPTLTLAEVQPSDAGIYSVIVSDISGSVTSAEARLTLVPVPVRPSVSRGTVVTLGGPAIPGDEIIDAVSVAAGRDHGVALRTDGTVVGWGGIESTPPAGLSDVVAISAGDLFSLALRRDGTVVSWGIAPALPRNLVGVTAIDAGGQTAMALKADGTVTKW